MKLFHNLADGIIGMLTLWFGQGEGIGILGICVILIVIGFFAAGTIKNRKSKTVVLSAFILFFLVCDVVYLSGGMLGHLFSALIFGAIMMIFFGLAARYILQALFFK